MSKWMDRVAESFNLNSEYKKREGNIDVTSEGEERRVCTIVREEWRVHKK